MDANLNLYRWDMVCGVKPVTEARGLATRASQEAVGRDGVGMRSPAYSSGKYK